MALRPSSPVMRNIAPRCNNYLNLMTHSTGHSPIRPSSPIPGQGLVIRGLNLMNQSVSLASSASHSPISTPPNELVNHQPMFPHSHLRTECFLFDRVWNRLILSNPKLMHSIPNRLVFLMGAPGSGKGTVTPHIIKSQGITNESISTSSLLNTPEMREMINQGRLIDDETVLELLIKKLSTMNKDSPVIIDGFPRSENQVQCVTALFEMMQKLSAYTGAPAPEFDVVVLHVNADTSIARQAQRGIDAKLHNEAIKSGKKTGKPMEERATDFDINLIKKRYNCYESEVHSLMNLSRAFPFHILNAETTIDKVVDQMLPIFQPTKQSPSQSSAHLAVPQPKHI
ncbi:P-loop containing nucleoside triphosphate hydrolase protein [Conidiobolus coronatus NRRL 28638]|uniref:p-loop containing nucleoside triphosphate hydrolase protein n=1 Tax=Conidiobolus coronatus (strain ATCC 28846 / CBS 209.66 / NRRL 28638) TaxID=796925 RepID=A0A137P1E2_CONC2|nr:P-loop containing nucleoside triphosphate hydrolase protein [Conidiobolus coronatus NRRL 28638]|eukprot:KXN68863.1 P-loop containing nucleoside triphosphate hydrolase protein [Conidiobolus coronatus NRRL 28638]